MRWAESMILPGGGSRRQILIQINAGQAFVIKYEDLVNSPQEYLEDLGEKLSIDWREFEYQRIHNRSIGKHRQILDRLECEQIIQKAGEKMGALGYRL